MRRSQFVFAGLVWVSIWSSIGFAQTHKPAGIALWAANKATASIVLPEADKRAGALVKATLSRYLRDFFAIELPVAQSVAGSGLHVIAGTPDNNPSLSQMVKDGLKLTTADLGEEGFQLLSAGDVSAPRIIIYGKTPAALKHGCQELLFYHVSANGRGGSVDWPLDVVRKPELAYRGIYMLPCWSQHDSIESWKRVLRFNSELTLNRNWFWLDGFPVAGHKAISHVAGQKSDYEKTDLASERNVQSLIDLVNAEDMKFYIGGGWMTWHHEQAIGKDPALAKDYYTAYLRTFKGVGGLYFEPPGEGYEAQDWALKAKVMHELIAEVSAAQPQFEFAIAIGRFNNAEYLKMMAKLDPKRVYWWWCWGNPFDDKAYEMYPSILGWHTIVRLSDIHGSMVPPSESSKRLSGMATSYDPGMGFGNPWNGGATLGGAKGPRNFDPYTMPYFSHEYRFRERCWDTRISDAAFAERLGRRLFDVDMPKEAIGHYLKLADLCFKPGEADEPGLKAIEGFVQAHASEGTLRNRDTLKRMREALEGLSKVRAAAAAGAK